VHFDRASNVRQCAVKVWFLYFDGCPNWQVADSCLTEAMRLTGHSYILVERRLIARGEEAHESHFRGSPTILIDGEGPFAGSGASSYGLTCRVYSRSQGLAGAPTVDELVAVLIGHA
jgi:hypothetical protein